MPTVSKPQRAFVSLQNADAKTRKAAEAMLALARADRSGVWSRGTNSHKKVSK